MPVSEGSMQNGRADEIFLDAESLLVDSLEQLDAGKLRNAAEKAWGATLTGCGRKVRRSAAVYGASTISAAFGM